ncbi:hypothetical protein [Nonomuraea sp. NPDC005650]|uniref:hypothetical protein n=1 Tax=Nonomuraea sp. NPDC005650 TaxID=3157045 RepID=UPI0033B37A30
MITDPQQIVNVIAYPTGFVFFDRDAHNVSTWFATKGVRAADGEKLARLLRAEACGF